MRKRLKVIKNPTESEVIMVTREAIQKMKIEFPSISMGNHDVEYLKDFKDDDVVGVVAGDLENIHDKNADLWFVNIGYFKEHYTILREK